MASAPQSWVHDALAADLARKLRNDGKSWTWLNATIGAWSGPRPDIMAFPRFRYDIPQIHAYEIKVSRSDLLSDLNSEKWRKYQQHCQSVTFAMPHGIATKDDIPAECGVMFRTGRGWRTERRAQNLGSPCSIQAMAKLLTCHPSREACEGLASHRKSELTYRAEQNFRRECGERFGHHLARLVADIASGKDPASDARERAKKIVEEAEYESAQIKAALAPVLELLGIDPAAGYWNIAQRIREVESDLSADSRVQRVEAALAQARKALDSVATRAAA